MPPSIEYVVKDRDSLTKIAKQFHTSVDALQIENAIGNPDKLKVGQRLLIPASANTDKYPKAWRRPHETSNNADVEEMAENWFEKRRVATIELLDGLIKKLHNAAESTLIQKKAEVTLTPKRVAKKTKTEAQPTQQKDGKKKRFDHADLKARLGKTAHVVTFEGVTLNRNERLQIVASISVCEGNFSSINADSEFRGAGDTSYAHVVHVGLSWGLIQFTQDGGSLGRVLKRMHEKAPAKFRATFGSNWNELLTLTNSGLSNAPEISLGVPAPQSGLEYWANLKKSARQSFHSSRTEIRGKRVQPIAISDNRMKEDIWAGEWKKRFIAAGQVLEFQEAQLELAVEEYLNRAITYCATQNIRSALGIAYVGACVIRGAAKQLIVEAAQSLGLTTPFESSDDERKAVEALAKKQFTKRPNGKPIQAEEFTRAARLLKDELGFLAEDLYAVSTYGANFDK
ncbi:MAG TPA: LysM peptidoglycan-binding domain-containing protein [Noviherbaspirillum sp.]|nr:LysM peptidoglycan-binding domain-containing protein [Noviherbaspirillum sp.]